MSTANWAISVYFLFAENALWSPAAYPVGLPPFLRWLVFEAISAEESIKKSIGCMLNRLPENKLRRVLLYMRK